MLSVASKRYAEKGKQATFQVTENPQPLSEAYPGQFDVIVSSLCLMYVEPHLLKDHLIHLYTCLKPGGRLITSHWGHPRDVPSLKIVKFARFKAAGEPLPSLEELGNDGTFFFHDPSRYEPALKAAGFISTRTKKCNVPMAFQNASEFCEFYGQDIDATTRVQAMSSLLEEQGLDPRQPFSLPSEAIVVVSEKPC